MDREVFAKRHGFLNYEQMLNNSSMIIFDDGVRYLITETPKYFLAWIESYPEYPLGRYSTFAEAQTFLLAAFKEAEEASPMNIPVRLVSAFGEEESSFEGSLV